MFAEMSPSVSLASASNVTECRMLSLTAIFNWTIASSFRLRFPEPTTSGLKSLLLVAIS